MLGFLALQAIIYVYIVYILTYPLKTHLFTPNKGILEALF